jgi:hypothetical protein
MRDAKPPIAAFLEGLVVAPESGSRVGLNFLGPFLGEADSFIRHPLCAAKDKRKKKGVFVVGTKAPGNTDTFLEARK